MSLSTSFGRYLGMSNLEKIDFRPKALIQYIQNMDGKIHHVISHD